MCRLSLVDLTKLIKQRKQVIECYTGEVPSVDQYYRPWLTTQPAPCRPDCRFTGALNDFATRNGIAGWMWASFVCHHTRQVEAGEAVFLEAKKCTHCVCMCVCACGCVCMWACACLFERVGLQQSLVHKTSSATLHRFDFVSAFFFPGTIFGVTCFTCCVGHLTDRRATA